MRKIIKCTSPKLRTSVQRRYLRHLFIIKEMEKQDPN